MRLSPDRALLARVLLPLCLLLSACAGTSSPQADAARPTAPPSAPAGAVATGHYPDLFAEAGYGPVTTEIRAAGRFYFAEDYHQQYLAKNPDGYCGIGGTGVSCPIGLTTKTA